MAIENRKYRLQFNRLICADTKKPVVVELQLWNTGHAKTALHVGGAKELKRYRECCEATAKEF